MLCCSLPCSLSLTFSIVFIHQKRTRPEQESSSSAWWLGSLDWHPFQGYRPSCELVSIMRQAGGEKLSCCCSIKSWTSFSQIDLFPTQLQHLSVMGYYMEIIASLWWSQLLCWSLVHLLVIFLLCLWFPVDVVFLMVAASVSFSVQLCLFLLEV